MRRCGIPHCTKSWRWWMLFATAVSASANWPNKNSKNSCAANFMANQNLELLIVAAKLLRPVLDDLVFVGGCATGLLVTDEAAAEVRPTFDVDAIAEITSYVEYTTFGERLHKLGFTEDASEGAPIYRWQQGEIKLDLMPLDEKILGFSNRWYKAAMDSAQEFEIELAASLRTPILRSKPVDAEGTAGTGSSR